MMVIFPCNAFSELCLVQIKESMIHVNLIKFIVLATAIASACLVKLKMLIHSSAEIVEELRMASSV